MISLGIEGTAEKTGVGIVDSDGNILAMAGKQLFPEEGGIHPRIAAEHHAEWIPKLIPQAIEESGLSYDDMWKDYLTEEYELVKNSVILLEQIRTIDKRRLKEKICHLDDSLMAQVDKGIKISFALNT